MGAEGDEEQRVLGDAELPQLAAAGEVAVDAIHTSSAGGGGAETERGCCVAELQDGRWDTGCGFQGNGQRGPWAALNCAVITTFSGRARRGINTSMLSDLRDYSGVFPYFFLFFGGSFAARKNSDAMELAVREAAVGLGRAVEKEFSCAGGRESIVCD